MMCTFGPVPGVTFSVAPCALELTPRPGSADCAATVEVRAKEATVSALMKAIVSNNMLNKSGYS